MAKFALPDAIPREWSPLTAEAIETNFRRLFQITPLLGALTFAKFIALLDGNAHHLLHSNGSQGPVLLDAVSGEVSGLLPLANLVHFSATQRVWGRNSAGAGVAQEVSLSQLLNWISASVARGDLLVRGAANWSRLAVGAAGQFLKSDGTDPAWTTIGLVAADLTFSTTQRVLGRNTAGSGAGEEVTLLQLLEWIGGATQGDLLIRGNSVWQRLPIGTSGFVLTSNGAGSNPSWQVTGAFSFSATKRVLGRNTAGAGAGEEVTASQVLDWIGTAAQGDVLYRGASTWTLLPAGTANQFLQTAGASANPAWATPSGAGSIEDLIFQNYIYIVGRAAAPFAFGIAPPTVVGTWSANNHADGSYTQCTQTGTSINLRAGFDAAARTYFRRDNDPVLEFIITTGATMTNIRLWFLMSDTQISSADDLGGTSKYIGFRYSTVAGDGGWVGVTRDGTTQSVTATVATIGASTKYKLKIRVSGGTVFFSVNDGVEVSTASNVPAAATEFGIDACSITTSAGATHPFDFSRARCYYGS